MPHPEIFGGGVAAFDNALQAGVCPVMNELAQAGDAAIEEMRETFELADSGDPAAIGQLAARLVVALEQVSTNVNPKPEPHLANQKTTAKSSEPINFIARRTLPTEQLPEPVAIKPDTVKISQPSRIASTVKPVNIEQRQERSNVTEYATPQPTSRVSNVPKSMKVTAGSPVKAFATPLRRKTARQIVKVPAELPIATVKTQKRSAKEVKLATVELKPQTGPSVIETRAAITETAHVRTLIDTQYTGEEYLGDPGRALESEKYSGANEIVDAADFEDPGFLPDGFDEAAISDPIPSIPNSQTVQVKMEELFLADPVVALEDEAETVGQNEMAFDTEATEIYSELAAMIESNEKPVTEAALPFAIASEVFEPTDTMPVKLTAGRESADEVGQGNLKLAGYKNWPESNQLTARLDEMLEEMPDTEEISVLRRNLRALASELPKDLRQPKTSPEEITVHPELADALYWLLRFAGCENPGETVQVLAGRYGLDKFLLAITQYYLSNGKELLLASQPVTSAGDSTKRQHRFGRRLFGLLERLQIEPGPAILMAV